MYTLEVCASTLSSALAAQAAGAQRIELCSGLGVGGLTPSLGLLQTARACLTIPIYVLIRPRQGHFCYGDGELSVMLRDIALCREAGADGVVVGALDARGRLPQRQLRQLVAAAKGMGLTFHRAFDWVTDPIESFEILIDLGFDRVLTAGRAPTAYEGRHTLRQWVEYTAGRLTILPGGGITPSNIRSLAEQTGAREFHLSAKTAQLPPYPIPEALSEAEATHWESDARVIRAAWEQLQG